MSTRACIRIKKKIRMNYNDQHLTDCAIMLYHHHDGYPEGVGSDLKEYISDVVSKWACGWNPEMIATDLVRGVIKDDDGNPDLGYEPAICQHGDCEYGYEIDCDKQTLQCFKFGEDKEWRVSGIVPIPDRVLTKKED